MITVLEPPRQKPRKPPSARTNRERLMFFVGLTGFIVSAFFLHHSAVSDHFEREGRMKTGGEYSDAPNDHTLRIDNLESELSDTKELIQRLLKEGETDGGDGGEDGGEAVDGQRAVVVHDETPPERQEERPKQPSAAAAAAAIAPAAPPDAALVPFDLSVDHLQLIPSSALEIRLNAAEDFLPVVVGGGDKIPQFRFRLRPSVGAVAESVKDISAYQIQAEHAHFSTLIWDSGKVSVESMPRSVPWDGIALKIGTLVKWRVSVWDAAGKGPIASDWTKFGVGPSDDEWKGKWITHPQDIASFPKEANVWRGGVTSRMCDAWKKRRDLPVARARVELTDDKQVVAAILVVSGLGSFAASLDGIPLSSSSPFDPPMTDFTKRVSYRGYDVTKQFQTDKTHVVSIALGSGWWDMLPLTASIINVNILPSGSLTTVAELHLTYSDGTRAVKIPSGVEDWQVAKGFLRTSDLFTGDVIDLGVFQDIQTALVNDEKTSTGAINWIDPAIYQSDITAEVWRDDMKRRAAYFAERRAGVDDNSKYEKAEFTVAPIGKLVPIEAPPVLPIERIAPESIVNLGNGRWLFDFGKAMSGVLRFDDGLPDPIVPEGGYPRAHSVLTKVGKEEEFVTVVYGESLSLETGDVNLLNVAGMGLREKKGGNTPGNAGPCFPKDHEQTVTQRDVYIAPKQSSGSFANARQSLFTTHAFRFAEVCCTPTPPETVHALAYRTAFAEWGRFDSSSVVLNAAYEMTKNALNSNMLGTQTDCPHREKLQYGGDLVADSPVAMHFFDLSAFYSKIIHDWVDTQWDNGAYTETSIWQDLNDERGIGQGAGETVWASLPPVLTVRHMQQYGDVKLAEGSLDNHVRWLEFLKQNWEKGMETLKYKKDLENYNGQGLSGLGDWLSLLDRDTWLTHHAFYMASARAIAYLTNKIDVGNDKGVGRSALALADELKTRINSLYMRDEAFRAKPTLDLTPGPELGLFARIVPGEKRCAVVQNWLRVAASGSPTKVTWLSQEMNFLKEVNKNDLEEMKKVNLLQMQGDKPSWIWKRRHNTPEGILAMRYNLRALSDLGFHHVALTKAAGVGVPSFEYMLSHNATTLWETWFRAEDTFSRNHPMLGAVGEWLPSAVAGVELAPTTVGGEQLLFWPRIPTTMPTKRYPTDIADAPVVKFASAIQGTKRGDAAIAWAFVGLRKATQNNDVAVVAVSIRLLVPPSSKARLRLPGSGLSDGSAIKSHVEHLPDLEGAKSNANAKCTEKRKKGKGFPYNWEWDKEKKEWYKVSRGKAIGTPCKSFLFDDQVTQTKWSSAEALPIDRKNGLEIELGPGLYNITIDKWQLHREIEDEPGYKTYDISQHEEDRVQCSNPATHSWDINDATYMI